jgi:hypothetical protein
MADAMEIKVNDLIGTRALTLEDGDRLHSLVVDQLRAGTTVTLDFHGITDVSTAFLNTAVGQLYAEIPPRELRRLLRIQNLSDSAQRSLEKVLIYARRFYQIDAQEA